MMPDRESCYRALTAHDVRFDGVFFVGVTSTRIYCRPVCRARTPRRDRCRFFANAAAAERVGFRPCLRCRPELAPGHAIVDSSVRLANEAVRRIAAGALNDGRIDDLARELGVGERQLRRVVEREVGASPVELAQTCRLLLAKRLLSDTALPVTQVAYTSGFRSVRRFNALFLARYRLSPSALRRAVTPAAATTPGPRDALDANGGEETIALTLAYRPPLAWTALLGFLAARATPGVEHVEHDCYSRTVRIDGHTGWVSVRPTASRDNRPDSLRVELTVSLLPVLMPLLARLRALFDLDASPRDIEDHLARGGLHDHVRRMPGLRLPGAVDGFELAWRALLGQQVTVRGATTLSGRLVAAFGDPIETVVPSLTRLSPSADSIADAPVSALAAIGLPRARAEALRGLARLVADGMIRLEPGSDGDQFAGRLTDLPGVGDWTAQYIAMRALRWPDAFPAGDLALRRAAGGLTPARLRDAAERWRPWRAYAAMHLWSESASARI